MIRPTCLERLCRIPHQRRELDLGQLQVQCARLQSRQVNRLTDEPRQAKSLVLHLPDQLPQSIGWQCSVTVQLA